jgi:hypothetical protein
MSRLFPVRLESQEKLTHERRCGITDLGSGDGLPISALACETGADYMTDFSDVNEKIQNLGSRQSQVSPRALSLLPSSKNDAKEIPPRWLSSAETYPASVGESIMWETIFFQ